MNEFFYPRLLSVQAFEPYRLGTVWSTGEVLEIDVEQVLRQFSLDEILKPEVFARVHTDGHSIEWFDTELGADNAFAWGKEQAGEVSHEMFDGWMRSNKLSLSGVAAALGISRRMVSYYRTAHKPIPRAIWLACLGWEITRPQEQTLPRALPTAQEYAAFHP